MPRKVLVWIAKGDRFLVLRRARFPSVPGWHPVTGNVEDEEDLVQAARREVAEETGLAVEPLPLGLSVAFERYGKKLTEHAFAARADQDPTLSPEHDAFEWVEAEEAARRVAFDFQRAALAAAVAALTPRRTR